MILITKEDHENHSMMYRKLKGMNEKYFLLIAGDNYYPCAGSENWKGCFATYEEAAARIEEFEDGYREVKTGLKKKRKSVPNFRYRIDGIVYDWYEIVDLREWIK